jgi:cytochrome c oxidase assembly protein subunit 11
VSVKGGGNNRTATRLALVVGVMLVLSFAAAPFYDLFCRVTGYGGTTTTAESPAAPARDETVLVRFDANVNGSLDWRFQPVHRTMRVRIGEEALAFYEAENLSGAVTAGTASFNVTPHSAGNFFAKIACFCFEMQVLQPGETVQMPVSFFVDPAMLEDRDAKGVRVITLSYTMHRSDPPQAETETASAHPTVATVKSPRDPQSAPQANVN